MTANLRHTALDHHPVDYSATTHTLRVHMLELMSNQNTKLHEIALTVPFGTTSSEIAQVLNEVSVGVGPHGHPLFTLDQIESFRAFAKTRGWL